MSVGSIDLKNKPLICVVDDDEMFRDILSSILQHQGYELVVFASASLFLSSNTFSEKKFDLIVTDINMPGASGYDLCRTVRSHFSQDHIPIVMVTGNDAVNEKTIGLDAGADDFIQKPFRNDELLAKVNSLLNIRMQARQQIGRLTKFISPNIADLVIENQNPGAMKLHRAQVTVMFSDLRGFTAFSENAEPEEVLDVLNNYYTVVGNSALKYQATLGHLAGDGIMLFLNDPHPTPNHQDIGLQLALEIRQVLNEQKVNWKSRGYHIDFGLGLAEGYATMGGIGFDRFWQYSVIGPVANFASRMCHYANNGQILVSHRFLERMVNKHLFQTESIGSITLKGIEKTVKAFNVVGEAQEIIQFKAG
ncbi:MAG: response regulator [Bdellovibrionaceae bacterium]|nr:response regulator [Pseudobdellovibrionaceae bacterium]